MPRPFAEEARRIQLRMTNIDAAQRRMADEIAKNVETTVGQIEDIIHVTGLNTDKVLERVGEDTAAQGGPFVPLAENFKRDASKWRDGYGDEIARLATIVDRLTGLDQALKSFPLVMPLLADTHVSSGFGRRVDPFTGRAAFHYGLDFVGALRTPVYVTSAGVVTIAGRNGPYGNLVEVDHGNGIKTRYGHLYEIQVKVGQHVAYQQQIGLLGSTGRSTGPHLHYEVRFNGTLRDPARFLEAGRYVFQG
jgi:murein DD-endopeptidase MepM/ murein hydrolase activator NlpD